jgi:hypothetical protein
VFHFETKSNNNNNNKQQNKTYVAKVVLGKHLVVVEQRLVQVKHNGALLGRARRQAVEVFFPLSLQLKEIRLPLARVAVHLDGGLLVTQVVDTGSRRLLGASVIVVLLVLWNQCA